MHRNNFFCGALVVAALFAGFPAAPALRAQPTEATVQSRLLVIFDTSSDMKKRVPAVQKALNTALLTLSMNNQLRSGDSIGVWTFDQDLRTGEFPLQNWDSGNAAKIGDAISKFIGKQHYTKSTSFEVLQPLLNRVVENSERLTVLIFCDGESSLGGTPYDDAVNQLLQQKQAEQKKALEPIVVLLRSQLGKYTGCTVSLPPAPVNIPEFPPLPKPPPPPPPKLTNATPPPPPPVVGTPIILIGKKIETNPPPPMTNSVPTNLPTTNGSVAPAEQTNQSAVPPTNPVVVKTIVVAATNTPASSPETADSNDKHFLIIGGSLLGVAVALGMIVWLRTHRKDSSLITRSMNDRR